MNVIEIRNYAFRSSDIKLFNKWQRGFDDYVLTIEFYDGKILRINGNSESINNGYQDIINAIKSSNAEPTKEATNEPTL